MFAVWVPRVLYRKSFTLDVIHILRQRLRSMPTTLIFNAGRGILYIKGLLPGRTTMARIKAAIAEVHRQLQRLGYHPRPQQCTHRTIIESIGDGSVGARVVVLRAT